LGSGGVRLSSRHHLGDQEPPVPDEGAGARVAPGTGQRRAAPGVGGGTAFSDREGARRAGTAAQRALRPRLAPRRPAGRRPGPPAMTEWDESEAALEQRLRTWAIPVALAGAFILVAIFPTLVRIFFSMWVHEIGHATAAWMCGYLAFPGPWLTPM